MSALRDYAQQFGQFSPLYRLLAEHGEEFTFSPLPADEEQGRAKACYQNATLRVLTPWGDTDDSVTYYEGLCRTGRGTTFSHAWCVKDGKVLELTLRHNDSECPFCLGEGELHPTDHWGYEQSDEDDENEEYVDDAETIPCEQCDATGKTEAVDRTGTTYLGVPVDAATLRRIILGKGSYTCFDGDGFEQVLAALGIELGSLRV